MMPKMESPFGRDLEIVWLRHHEQIAVAVDTGTVKPYPTWEAFMNERFNGNVFLKFLRQETYYTTADWQHKWDFTDEWLRLMKKYMDEDKYHTLSKEELKVPANTVTMRLKRGACVAIHQARIDLNMQKLKQERQMAQATKELVNSKPLVREFRIADPYRRDEELVVRLDGMVAQVTYPTPLSKAHLAAWMKGQGPLQRQW